MVTVASFMGVAWPSNIDDWGRQEHQNRGDGSRPDFSLGGDSGSGLKRKRSPGGSE